MGAVCLAQLESSAPEARLARGLDAALAFFDAFVCPQAPPREAKAAEALVQTMRLERTGAPAHDERAQRADAMAAAFRNAFGVLITQRRDLLREVLAAADKARVPAQSPQRKAAAAPRRHAMAPAAVP